MKKLICAILTAVLLCACAAFAEGTLMFTSADTEDKLEQMIPVLDSLAESMNVESDDLTVRVPYDSENANLIWDQLRLMSAKWLSRDEAYRTTVGDVTIPSQVMESLAKIAFANRWNPLPAIPAGDDSAAIVYDPAADAYRVTLSEDDGHHIVIERYATDGVALVVNCGLFDEADQRLGGLTARLIETGEEAPLYPYAVQEAHAEEEGDFNGLWATECAIQFVDPNPTAAPIPTAQATEVPEAPAAEYRTLSNGSRGEDVRALQRRLNELGYNSGSADGVFGGGTRRAVMSFQEAIKFDEDGVATPEVQRRLFAASAPEYDPYQTLSRGASGPRVESLQERLRELGYTAAPVDGDFGSRLQTAVKLFQRNAGLKADGIAGQATLKALERRSAPSCDSFIDLQKGDSGYRVKEMQRRLKELGFFDHSASGTYDGNTAEAVAWFKEVYDLDGSGKSASADIIELMFEDLDPVEDRDIIDDDYDETDDDEDDYVEDDDDDYVDDDDEKVNDRKKSTKDEDSDKKKYEEDDDDDYDDDYDDYDDYDDDYVDYDDDDAEYDDFDEDDEF